MALPTPPEAVLFDLDDSLLVLDADVEPAWRRAAAALRHDLGGVEVEAFLACVETVSAEYWSDPERHRIGRLDIPWARTQVAARTLAALGLDGPGLATRLAGAYTAERLAGERLFPEAVDVLDGLRQAGVRMGLVTNGGSAEQRRKIHRFGLTAYFPVIVVEGELGVGKPDPRPFTTALAALEAEPATAWMIGNDLSLDIAPARSLGLTTVWHDHLGRGLPADASVRPDITVQSMAELKAALLGDQHVLWDRHPPVLG